MMKFTQTIQVELLNYKNDYFLSLQIFFYTWTLYFKSGLRCIIYSLRKLFNHASLNLQLDL